jgi:hypothetical protein
LLAARGGDSHRYPNGALAVGSLAERAGEFSTAKMQLLRSDGVPCFNDEPAALDGNEVANGGKVGCHLAQQITEGPHGSREPQLLFKAKGTSRLRE